MDTYETMNCTCLPTPDIGSVNANAIGDYLSFVAESVNRLSYSGTVLTDSNIDNGCYGPCSLHQSNSTSKVASRHFQTLSTCQSGFREGIRSFTAVI